MNSIEKIEIISENRVTKARVNGNEPLKGVTSVKFKHNAIDKNPEVTLTLEISN